MLQDYHKTLQLPNDHSLLTILLTKIVNEILNSQMKACTFDELVREMGSDGHFLYHSEVMWLSGGWVIERGISDRNLFCDLMSRGSSPGVTNVVPAGTRSPVPTRSIARFFKVWDDKYIFKGISLLFLLCLQKILGTTKFWRARKNWGVTAFECSPWLRTCWPHDIQTSGTSE